MKLPTNVLKKSSVAVFKPVYLGFLLTSFLGLLSVPKVASAVPSCGEIGQPNPGDICSTEVRVSRGPIGDGNADYDFTHNATEGYKIIDYRVHVHSVTGNTSAPNVFYKAAGSTTVSEQSVNEVISRLDDLFAKAEARAEEKQALAELKYRYQRDFKNNYQSASRYFTSHAGLQITGQVRPEWSSWGTRKARGKVDASIYVNQVYLGTPSSLQQAAEQYKSQLFKITQNSGGQGDNSSTCVSVDSRRGWQQFTLPGSFTHIASVSGSWSVDDRTYSRVGPEGHSEPGLEPYNQYKLDQSLPFGALLVGGPNSGYFWAKGPQELNSPITSTVMTINDTAFSDNAESLKVCFSR